MLALLATAAALVDDFERAARQAVYGDDVRVAMQTDIQEVVLTGGTDGRPVGSSSTAGFGSAAGTSTVTTKRWSSPR
ncbi:hypothetical protein SALBM311S_00572 [Streptomyces alboniger]